MDDMPRVPPNLLPSRMVPRGGVMMRAESPPAAHYRPADAADVDAVHALRREFYEEDGSPWHDEPARAPSRRC